MACVGKLPPAGDDESDDESGSDGMMMIELVSSGNGDVVSGENKVEVPRRAAAVGDSCVYTHVGSWQAVRAY